MSRRDDVLARIQNLPPQATAKRVRSISIGRQIARDLEELKEGATPPMANALHDAALAFYRSMDGEAPVDELVVAIENIPAS